MHGLEHGHELRCGHKLGCSHGQNWFRNACTVLRTFIRWGCQCKEWGIYLQTISNFRAIYMLWSGTARSGVYYEVQIAWVSTTMSDREQWPVAAYHDSNCNIPPRVLPNNVQTSRFAWPLHV